MPQSSECQACFCGTCMPMSECDDTCWSLGLCVADACPTGDANCIVANCSAYLGAANATTTALANCGAGCTDVCASSVPVAGTGGAGGVGGSTGAREVCDACLGERCPTEYQTCIAAPACSSELDCALSCGSLTDIICLLTCSTTGLSVDLYPCASTNCVAECTL